MVEIWKPVLGCNGEYQVSNLGNVKNTITGTVFKQWVASNGYFQVKLNIKGKRGNKSVHRLVAQSFIKNSNNKPCVNHKDGNKKNNFVDNLEWVSFKENSIHSIKNGLQKVKKGAESSGYNRKGILHHQSLRCKCTKTGKLFYCLEEASIYTGFSKAAISRYLSGKRKNKTTIVKI